MLSTTSCKRPNSKYHRSTINYLCLLKETDTHWRAKGGKGSFNWRMKFQVELGPRCRATKFPYLTLQMWDRDILKWNDCIAECMLDLGTYFRRAYKKKNQVLKMFESQLTEKGQQTMIETQQALVDEQVLRFFLFFFVKLILCVVCFINLLLSFFQHIR